MDGALRALELSKTETMSLITRCNYIIEQSNNAIAKAVTDKQVYERELDDIYQAIYKLSPKGETQNDD